MSNPKASCLITIAPRGKSWHGQVLQSDLFGSAVRPFCGPSDVNVPASSGDPVGAGPGVHSFISTTLDSSCASVSVIVASARCAAAFNLEAMWAKAKAGARREALFWGFTSVQAEAVKSVAFCRDLGLLLHVGCVK